MIPGARIRELDAMPMREKVKHVINAAQPFHTHRLTDWEAAAHISRTANYIGTLWGVGTEGRDAAAVLVWRDILTHPAVYRRVFADWVGSVYSKRSDTLMDRSDQAEHQSAVGGSPVHWKGSRLDRSMERYRHHEPERFGHETVLWSLDRAPLGLEMLNDAPPVRAVVRLRDLGWYFGGFLGTVMLWGYLGHVNVVLLRDAIPDIPTTVGVDLNEFVTGAGRLLHGTVYMSVWNQLIRLLNETGCNLTVPVPDLIHVPHDWYQALIDRGESANVRVVFRGISGPTRRRQFYRRPLASVPEWTVPSDDDPTIKNLQAQIYAATGGSADWQQGQTMLRSIRGNTSGEYDLVERFAPMPMPPHPMPGLILLWTGLFEGGWERIYRPAAIRELVLSWIAIPCLETGLAIEEWGRSWSVEQRQSPNTLSETQVRDSVITGTQIELTPLRTLTLDGIAVLDPSGPMGSGFRTYALDKMRLRSETERLLYSWLQVDRCTTVERMTVRAPSTTVDEFGRWEDSGIEMPPNLIRLRGRHRMIEYLAAGHIGPVAKTRTDETVLDDLWHEATFQAERRYWRPLVWSHWPAQLTLEAADLTPEFWMGALSVKPLVQHLVMIRCRMPTQDWLARILIMPRSNRMPNLGMATSNWLDLLQQARLAGGMHPLARRTVRLIAISQPRFAGDPPTTYIDQHLFPGKPPTMDTTAESRSRPPYGTDFYHYPNLTVIQITNAGLLEIPWGLWELLTSTQRTAVQSDRDRIRVQDLYWEISHNAIHGLSLRTLLALAWYDMIAMASSLRGHTTLVHINLYQNPVQDLIVTQYNGSLESYINSVLDSAPPYLSPNANKALEWWHKDRARVTSFIGSRFEFVPMKEFRDKFNAMWNRKDRLWI